MPEGLDECRPVLGDAIEDGRWIYEEASTLTHYARLTRITVAGTLASWLLGRRPHSKSPRAVRRPFCESELSAHESTGCVQMPV